MPTLLVNGAPVAACELAETRKARRRGLLKRDGIDGAMLITPCRSVHTFGMRFDIDVAYLKRAPDNAFRVLRSGSLPRRRFGRPSLHSTAILEAAAGAFATWGLQDGSRVQITDEHKLQ